MIGFLTGKEFEVNALADGGGAPVGLALLALAAAARRRRAVQAKSGRNSGGWPARSPAPRIRPRKICLERL